LQFLQETARCERQIPPSLVDRTHFVPGALLQVRQRHGCQAAGLHFFLHGDGRHHRETSIDAHQTLDNLNRTQFHRNAQTDPGLKTQLVDETPGGTSLVKQNQGIGFQILQQDRGPLR
jgi:hypothetical protein